MTNTKKRIEESSKQKNQIKRTPSSKKKPPPTPNPSSDSIPFQTHCISCVPYVPSAITHILPITLGPNSTWVIVVRALGEMEIYVVSKGAWFLEKEISGGKNKAISSIVYAKLSEEEPQHRDSQTSQRNFEKKSKSLDESVRLFTSSLNGTITEWNLDKLIPKRTVNGCTNGIWSLALDAKGRRLVAGGEDGSVVIFDLVEQHEDGTWPVLQRWMYPQHRILSLMWSAEDTWIVAGTDQSKLVRFDVVGRRPAEHLQLAVGVVRDGKKKHTASAVAWCLQQVNDDQLAVGTSLGRIEIVDMRSFTLLQSIQAHDAFDLTQLDFSPASLHLYSASIDGTVTLTHFSKELRQWQVVHSRKYHENDVRALRLLSLGSEVQNHLVTGGLDTYITHLNLSKCSFDKAKPDRVQNFGRSRIAVVSRLEGSVLLFARLQEKIDVYQFKKLANLSMVEEGGDPELIYLSCLKFKTAEMIVDMAVSPDGQWLAATHGTTKVFHFNPPAFVQLRYKFPPLRQLCFALGVSDSTLLAGYDPCAKRIYVYTFTASTVHVTAVYPTPAYVVHLALSRDARLLAASDLHARLSLYDLTHAEHTAPADWVVFADTVLHLAFVSGTHDLLCTHALALRRYSCTPTALHLAYQVELPTPLTHVLQLSPTRMLGVASGQLYRIALPTDFRGSNAKRKHSGSQGATAPLLPIISAIQGYDGLMHIHSFTPTSNELFLVLRPFEEVLKTLPPTIMKKKFGKQ